jgi:hypothetical protein
MPRGSRRPSLLPAVVIARRLHPSSRGARRRPGRGIDSRWQDEIAWTLVQARRAFATSRPQDIDTWIRGTSGIGRAQGCRLVVGRTTADPSGHGPAVNGAPRPTLPRHRTSRPVTCPRSNLEQANGRPASWRASALERTTNGPASEEPSTIAQLEELGRRQWFATNGYRGVGRMDHEPEPHRPRIDRAGFTGSSGVHLRRVGVGSSVGSISPLGVDPVRGDRARDNGNRSRLRHSRTSRRRHSRTTSPG